MNGQPTAQNTRETGADGDLPRFRNWANPAHVRELAELWNVDPDLIRHWAPPTHALQLWRYAEQGSIRLLRITATNADRTVHRSERAVDPPGDARADLDIFLDYARRMDLRDRDGAPLIGWHDAGAFEAWKACSKGRPCDCSGLSHDRLRDAPPCTEDAPNASTPTASSTPTPRRRRPTARTR